MYSIPFSINNYTNINLSELQDIKIVYFKEVIFSNSLLCKYYRLYNELNHNINKLFYFITPYLNNEILINFCNYSLYMFVTNNVLDINNTLLKKCHFINEINNIEHFVFDKDEFEQTRMVQYDLIDVIDNGIFYNFLSRKESVSVNNWYLKKINIETESKLWSNTSIIKYKLQIFDKRYKEFTFPETTKIDRLIDFIFIYKEILMFESFEYLELFNNPKSEKRLYNFYSYVLNIFPTESDNFHFNNTPEIIKKILNPKNMDTQRLLLSISYLYNTIFPTYFASNSIDLNNITKKIIGSVEKRSEGNITEKIYNLFNDTNTKVNTKFDDTITKLVNNINYKDEFSTNSSVKTSFYNICRLNVYCNNTTIKNLFIIMIYLIKKIISPTSTDKKTKKNITVMVDEPPVFSNINIFYYANMLTTSKYYYYILEKNNNTYKIGDEIQEKSSNKRLYIILNKLKLSDNVSFQIIESSYINTVSILDFHNHVKIINGNDIKKDYTLLNSFPLGIKNNYLQPKISKKIKFIYHDKTTNNVYYLNNLCISNSNVDINYNFFDLDNYLLYFMYYKLILFNKINQVQYNPYVRQFSLNGFSDIDLNEYNSFMTSNLMKQSAYVKSKFQNIMYIYLTSNDHFMTTDIDLIKLYNILKTTSLSMSSLIEKHRTEIRRRLRDIFQVKFIESHPSRLLRYHGGGDKKEEKKERKERKEKKEKKKEENKESPFSYFIHIELDIIPGKHDPSTLKGFSGLLGTSGVRSLKGIQLGCENKKENILRNIDEIRNVSYKPKLLSKEYLLSHDPDFPVEKFLPESITPKEKTEEPIKEEPIKIKEEEPEEPKKIEKETKGGKSNQIANLFHNISFLNDYLQG
jgi:hypothetical protein